jgi:hypothetical protein
MLVVLSLLAGTGLIAPAVPARAADLLVDDFEAGLPAGRDANNIPIGFNTFQDPNSSVTIVTTAAPPAPVPGAGSPNNVLKMDLNVVSYAGFTHSLENAALDQWVAQDWSAYEGISFWLYGNNSGTTLFVDVLDNRNPGATTDDAERWSAPQGDRQRRAERRIRADRGAWLGPGRDHHAQPADLLRRQRDALRHRAGSPAHSCL